MDVREHPPVPLRTLFVSTVALCVPVAAQVLAPDAAVQYELLLWLLALIPAFLLAYHRGWRGAAAALASGMAVLSLSQAALTYLGSGVRDWTLMLAVVAIYLGVSIGIGWVTELLHQARSHAERMEDEARSAALRAQAVAERLSAVAAAASGVLGSLEPAALAETLSACASTVVSFGTFELLLNDSHLHALVPAGPVQTSALEGRPALVAEAEAAIGASASRVVPFGAEAQTGPAGTAALIPVAAEGEVLGLLLVTGSESHGFTPEDLQVLEALAACAAGALLNIDMLLARDGAEHALRLSEGRFRTLIEDASELIVILDAEGHVRYESPAVPRLLGQRRGRHPLACVHPSERESARARLAGLMGKRSGTLVSEVRVMDRTGAWRILEVLATNLMHDPAVAGIVVNARDVTVYRQATEALRESEHRYRRFFENDLAGAFLADARSFSKKRR